MPERVAPRSEAVCRCFVKKGRWTLDYTELCRLDCEAAAPSMTHLHTWSSTENNNNNAYNVNFNNGNVNNNNKNNSNKVRAVRDFWQTDLFHQPIPLSDFYLAY